MKLTADWQRVLRHAWSVRWMVIAAIFSALEVALPFLDGLLPVPPRVFAVSAGLATAAAFVTRIVAQKQFQETDNADQ